MNPQASQKLLGTLTPDLAPIRSQLERASVAIQALGTTCQSAAASAASLESALNRKDVPQGQTHRSTSRKGRMVR